MNTIGCSFLECSINFDYDTVTDCCISHNDSRGLPLLLKDYHGGTIDWEYLFSIKAKRIEQQKQKTIYDCEGCYRLCDYKFTEERKISEFHFSHCRACNAKCIYCSKEYSEGSRNYDTYPIIKDLIEKGYYKSGGEATFQGGEPTLMFHFDDLIELFVHNGTQIRVHSSAIRYSQTVCNALKINKGKIVISLDCANKDVYKKIKQVDSYNYVIENIKKYSLANPVNTIIKYIIIPGINDNLTEIDRFIKLLKSLGITNSALDIEIQYARKYENKYVSEHIFLLVDYFKQKAFESGINVLIYSFLSYVLNNRRIKEYIGISIKPIYSYLVKKHENKSKNIEYNR